MDSPRCDLGRSDPKDEIDGCMVRVVGQWRKHEKDGESVDEKPCASCGRILEVSERDSDSFIGRMGPDYMMEFVIIIIISPEW
jgi:hypothetical protein